MTLHGTCARCGHSAELTFDPTSNGADRPTICGACHDHLDRQMAQRRQRANRRPLRGFLP